MYTGKSNSKKNERNQTQYPCTISVSRRNRIVQELEEYYRTMHACVRGTLPRRVPIINRHKGKMRVYAAGKLTHVCDPPTKGNDGATDGFQRGAMPVARESFDHINSLFAETCSIIDQSVNLIREAEVFDVYLIFLRIFQKCRFDLTRHSSMN
ncbi:hypothetical protein EW146_g6515 [Bondarzewia mesenterica]|uniref:Uncharacterized protein n=1 Tax=Bondarzewia mesenterica TaxID=1095465 RepID=A0A4S4LNH0_9AGAM|nr:hypothetical protein EW146_g6515 [Bondarzewia mesenterica]